MTKQVTDNDLKIFFGRNSKKYLNYWYARFQKEKGYDLVLMYTSHNDLSSSNIKDDLTIGIYRSGTAETTGYQIIAPGVNGTAIFIKDIDIPSEIHIALDKLYSTNGVTEDNHIGEPIFITSSNPLENFITSKGGQNKMKRAPKLHWPALFLGPIWMFYRKLYVPAIAITIGEIAFIMLIKYFLNYEITGFLFFTIFFTLTATPIAIWNAKKKIEGINNNKITVEAREERIRATGGTSIASAIVVVLLLIAFIWDKGIDRVVFLSVKPLPSTNQIIDPNHNVQVDTSDNKDQDSEDDSAQKLADLQKKAIQMDKIMAGPASTLNDKRKAAAIYIDLYNLFTDQKQKVVYLLKAALYRDQIAAAPNSTLDDKRRVAWTYHELYECMSDNAQKLNYLMKCAGYVDQIVADQDSKIDDKRIARSLVYNILSNDLTDPTQRLTYLLKSAECSDQIVVDQASTPGDILQAELAHDNIWRLMTDPAQKQAHRNKSRKYGELFSQATNGEPYLLPNINWTEN